MADEAERTIDADGRESTHSDESAGDRRGERESDRTAVDEGAESFVDLERDLRAFRGEGDRVRGRAVDARRIPTSDVPTDYPLTPTTSEVLELLVEPQGTETEPQPIYFEWPPGEDGPLATLLALRDVDPGSFADLHGEVVPLSIEGEWLVHDLPETMPRGSKRGVLGVWASVALVAAGLAVAPVIDVLVIQVVYGVVTFLLLPVSTYYDAWYLRTHTDWDSTPLGWTVLTFLPWLNALVALAYLAVRRTAETF